MKDGFDSVRAVLPEQLRAALTTCRWDKVNEIRLRCGQIPTLLRGDTECEVPECAFVTPQMLEELIDRASAFSRYAVAEQLASGFLTLPGGHRIGVCGSAVCIDGTIRSFRSISSVCLRLARSCEGAADGLRVSDSTLVIGPPGSGKTTLLRDLVRQMSDGGARIAVVDSRGELAALSDGAAQLPIGRQTDVLSDCGKAEGMELLLRTMNPQWIAVDEITAMEDVQAMVRASFCGVRLLATAHAASKEELQRRPLYRELLRSEVSEISSYLTEQRNGGKRGFADSRDRILPCHGGGIRCGVVNGCLGSCARACAA